MPKTSISASDVPRGFSFASAACGIKKAKPHGSKQAGNKQGHNPAAGLLVDAALLVSEVPATAAGVFTQNRVVAAPVVVSREHLHASRRAMRAIVVNSGNANCCTGTAGMRGARATAAAVAREIGCRASQVLVCSTGVIGVPMPAQKLLRAIPALAAAREDSAAAFAGVTRAIMTTDTRPKWAAASCIIGGRRVRLLGCAKGAGMIHPHMATMLAFVLTDAAIAAPVLQKLLRDAANHTFNCISIDGDTSTNDTLLLLANGAGVEKRNSKLEARNAGAEFRKFAAALESVCRSLALQIVADGEGAQRVIEVVVRGTRSDADAKRVANTIATSPLVKTALSGADPNWGRILAAAGRSGVEFDPNRARIWMAGIPVFRHGVPLPFDERAAHRALLAKHVPIVVDLGEPANSSARHSPRATRHSATVWTCDFSEEYVKVNASYRS